MRHRDFANSAGIPPETFSSILHRKRIPSQKACKQLERASRELGYRIPARLWFSGTKVQLQKEFRRLKNHRILVELQVYDEGAA